MPLMMDLHIHEVENSVCDYFDFEKAASKLHIKMKEVLTSNEYQVYTGLYIEGKDDDVVSVECGFKSDSKAKRVRQIKATIIKKVKALFKKGGIEVLNE